MSEKVDQSKGHSKISKQSRDQSHTFPSDLTDFEQQIARDMKRFAQKQADENKLENSMLESTLPDIKFSLQKDNGALSNFSGDRSEIKMKSFSVSKASEAKNTSDSAFGSIQKSVDSKGNQKSGRSGGKSKRSPRKEKKNDQSRQTFGDLKAQAKA